MPAQAHASVAAARRGRYVYGDLSSVSLSCAFVLGIVPLLTALLIHVAALLDHYENCKQGRAHVLQKDHAFKGRR